MTSEFWWEQKVKDVRNHGSYPESLWRQEGILYSAVVLNAVVHKGAFYKDSCIPVSRVDQQDQNHKKELKSGLCHQGPQFKYSSAEGGPLSSFRLLPHGSFFVKTTILTVFILPGSF